MVLAALYLGVGIVGTFVVGWVLLPWVVAGVVLVLAYDLEWGGRVIHNDLGFALAWGAFPVLVGAASAGLCT